jgi:nucleotide-binding universal stress UspA family protein
MSRKLKMPAIRHLHDDRRGVESTTLPIVVGIDGTAGSESALTWAVRTAGLHQWPLRVVLVADPPPVQSYRSYTPPGSGETFLLQRPARTTVDDLEHAVVYARDRLPADLVTGRHTPGNPADVLVDESMRASMIAVGSRGRSSATAALLGSVSATVAARAGSPVVVVRPTEGVPNSGERRIVVGVDGSEDADDALAFAFAEASARKLPLTVVHCGLGVVAEAVKLAVSFSQLLPDVSTRLRAHRQRFPDVQVTTSLVEGDPTSKLADLSQGAELTVVGSHGRGRISGLLLGSVSQGLLRHARSPVAVTHRPKQPIGDHQT